MPTPEVADALLEMALKMYARAPRAATARALTVLRDSLVTELGCSEAQAVQAIRGAMRRRAARSGHPEIRRMGAAL